MKDIFFKVINNMVPDYLLELKPEKKKEGRYMLWTRHEYTPPSWRITKYKKSFLPFAVHLWNNLDEETQSITNYERFKDALGANIRENPLFLIGTRQEQVIMAKLRMHAAIWTVTFNQCTLSNLLLAHVGLLMKMNSIFFLDVLYLIDQE